MFWKYTCVFTVHEKYNVLENFQWIQFSFMYSYESGHGKILSQMFTSGSISNIYILYQTYNDNNIVLDLGRPWQKFTLSFLPRPCSQFCQGLSIAFPKILNFETRNENSYLIKGGGYQPKRMIPCLKKKKKKSENDLSCTSFTVIFVSPELSSVRDYVITHSVRSMCTRSIYVCSMYVVFCKIDHCIHIHWCIVMGLGHNGPYSWKQNNLVQE